MRKPVILFVDDEKTVLNSLRQELEFTWGTEYTLELAESAEEGLEILLEMLAEGAEVRVVVSDHLMPGMRGDQFLTMVRKINPAISCILLTGNANIDELRSKAEAYAIYSCMAKPWDGQQLSQEIQRAASAYLAAS